MTISPAYFMPILVFFLVFIVVYALLSKTKILGESKFVHLFISFIAAIISFVTPSLIEFTKIFLSWIAVFIISLIFIILLFSFTSRNVEDVLKSKFLAAVVVLGLIAIFLGASINVFGPAMKPYLPGGEETLLIFHPAVFTGLILLIVGAVISYILTKTK